MVVTDDVVAIVALLAGATTLSVNMDSLSYRHRQRVRKLARHRAVFDMQQQRALAEVFYCAVPEPGKGDGIALAPAPKPVPVSLPAERANEPSDRIALIYRPKKKIARSRRRSVR